MISSLAHIDWHSFLARPPLASPSPASVAILTRDPILITGAGGSIGSALAHRLGAAGARLILLESSETSLFNLQVTFDESAEKNIATCYLGDVANRALLDEIFALHRPRLLFHAAAFKHVPLMEEQPLAAIANNILGTESLAAAASAYGARIALLSTDKAAAPVSTMGATKRVAEQIILAAGGVALRLGNVLASRGSVAEVFARQIETGMPLTVNDPAANRYFLTIREAVDQLLIAANQQDWPALLVPDLRQPQFIADLARFLARTLAPGRDIPLEFTEPRAGDKQTEQLWSATEIPEPPERGKLIRIGSPAPAASQLRGQLDAVRNAVNARDVAAALDALCSLVPDYTPSTTVLRLRGAAMSHE